MSVQELTNEQDLFDAKNVDGLVLVKIKADWCGPCKMYAPVLENFAEETSVPVYSLDADENPNVLQALEVQSIPTTLVYYDGTLKDKFLGVKSVSWLKRELDSYLTS